MIARLDDVEHFKCDDLTSNLEHPYTLKSKMRWSKNVLEERESLDQIIIGSMDPNVCVILALTLHLEHSVFEQSVDSPYLFGTSKQRIRLLFERITQETNFLASESSAPIGTHSICKLPATYARQNGCTKDDVDARGRWKSNKRIVDTYIDCLIPFPDAKVASTLCIGGPIKYSVSKDVSIDENLILQCVGTKILSFFPRQVSLVLGTALIWAVYDDEVSELVESVKVERIKRIILNANENMEVGTNSIKKIPLVVTGSDIHLVIDKCGIDDGNSEENPSRVNNETAFMIAQVRNIFC